MGDCCGAEEDEEEDGGAGGGTVFPLVVGVGEGWGLGGLVDAVGDGVGFGVGLRRQCDSIVTAEIAELLLMLGVRGIGRRLREVWKGNVF